MVLTLNRTGRRGLAGAAAIRSAGSVVCAGSNCWYGKAEEYKTSAGRNHPAEKTGRKNVANSKVNESNLKGHFTVTALFLCGVSEAPQTIVCVIYTD